MKFQDLRLFGKTNMLYNNNEMEKKKHRENLQNLQNFRLYRIYIAKT